MKIEDLIELYEHKKNEFGTNSYKQLSNLFREAKELHKKDFTGKDHEQSWRAFKGKNFEKIIEHIIRTEIEELGLKLINGNILEKTTSKNLSKELGIVKRNLLVDYGEFGSFLPDVDLILYNPSDYSILAVVSIKVTLRERIAQTGYWKIKLSEDEVTANIKVFFITLDEDGALSNSESKRKARAIVEIDTDGSYIMSEAVIAESDKVKLFDKFLHDIKILSSNIVEKRNV